jgi:hypothetical protein
MTDTNSSGLWWLLLVSLITTLLCVPFFRVIYGMGDEGLLLHGADLILQGKRLYVDFFELMPPGSYMLIAGWFDLVGISFGAARTLAVLTIVGIACFTFLACRQTSRNVPLSAILVIGWVMMSQWSSMQVSHHWFTTLFSMVTAWAALASLEQPGMRWPAVAGVAAGAATVVMQTVGTLVALAASIAFCNWRQSRSRFTIFGLGLALIPTGVVAFLGWQHALSAAFDDIVGFALTRYSPIQYVPFGQGTSIFDAPLACVFPLAALLLLPIIVLDRRTYLHDQRLRLSMAFALAGFVGCFPRPDIGHIGFTAPLALPLLAHCATRLTRSLRRTYRWAIAAVVVALCAPSGLSFAAISQIAFHAPIMSTPRGAVAFTSPKDLPNLLPKIAAVPPQDAFFFYPNLSTLAFLTAREHASKYDGFVPGYTTAAQYRDACLSAVRNASWMVVDRRFADYRNWKQIYPSMPDVEPQEATRFEEALDRAFETAATKGVFDLRHRRRKGVNDSVCYSIRAASH